MRVPEPDFLSSAENFVVRAAQVVSSSTGVVLCSGMCAKKECGHSTNNNISKRKTAIMR